MQKGQKAPARVAEAHEKRQAPKKLRAVELRMEGFTFTEIARQLGVSVRTIRDWRQKDEKFAVAFDSANESYRDFYVKHCREYALDPKNPYRHLMLMFLTKQADPSFRDNAKVEHVVSGDLTAALKKLAKIGRSE